MPPLVVPAAAPAHSSSTEQEAVPLLGRTAAAPGQDNSKEQMPAQARTGATGSATGVRRHKAPSGAVATEQGCAGTAAGLGGGDPAKGSRPPCHARGSPGAGGCAAVGSDTAGAPQAASGQPPPLWSPGGWLRGRGGGATPRPTPAPGTPAPAPGPTAGKAEGSGAGQWVPALGGVGLGLGGVEATTVAATLLGAAAGGAVAGPWGVTAGVCAFAPGMWR